MQTKPLEIRNRWTGSVTFTAEVDVSLPYGLRLGAAVKLAIAAEANLSEANLRIFESDVWMILSQHRAEVPALLSALREGRIDGSVYSGECACLVGPIANARGVDARTLECDSDRPAERWFMMIRPGDKPGDATGGGFAAGKAVEWIERWSAAHTAVA